VFCTPAKGVPLELGIGVNGQKTRMMGLPDGQESFMISLSVWTQNQSVTDRQTDRHLSTAKTALAEHRAGKNESKHPSLLKRKKELLFKIKG